NLRARPVLDRAASITAPDRNTVVIQLREPFEPLPLMLDATAMAIVPKHIYDGSDFRTNSMNQTRVGAGAFKLKEWRKGESIELVRNTDYWKRGLPYLDGILYRVVADAGQRSAQLESGAVQLASGGDIEPADVPRFRQQRSLAIAG